MLATWPTCACASLMSASQGKVDAPGAGAIKSLGISSRGPVALVQTHECEIQSKKPTFNKFKVRFFEAKLTLIVESTEV
jgi:hypothetical protein